MASSAPAPGTVTTAELRVSPSDLASAVALELQDVYPDVFATARLVALMEVASARALNPLLQPGQLSVGVTVEMTHSAPTPVGALVRAEATFREQEGKLFVFDVVGKDEGGEIGRAVHKRAIIDRERLEDKAQKRVNTPAPNL